VWRPTVDELVALRSTPVDELPRIAGYEVRCYTEWRDVGVLGYAANGYSLELTPRFITLITARVPLAARDARRPLPDGAESARRGSARLKSPGL
jgi:hypothetical protein